MGSETTDDPEVANNSRTTGKTESQSKSDDDKKGVRSAATSSGLLLQSSSAMFKCSTDQIDEFNVEYSHSLQWKTNGNKNKAAKAWSSQNGTGSL